MRGGVALAEDFVRHRGHEGSQEEAKEGCYVAGNARNDAGSFTTREGVLVYFIAQDILFSIAAKVEDIPFTAVNSIMRTRAPSGSNLPVKAIGMHLVLWG